MSSPPAAVVDQLLTILCGHLDLGPVTRHPIRVWRLSGVERLRPADAAHNSVVFKYATGPGLGEDEVLQWAVGHHLPVAALYASAVIDGVLGMLLEDLGETGRPATMADAASAAVRLHRLARIPGRTTWTGTALCQLPATCLAHLDRLHAAGRFTTDTDLRRLLATLDTVASGRAGGAHIPPFGPCHGELHPTSLHISRTGVRLLDFANAFNGSGLLDLAAWFGTRHPPDPARMRAMINVYVAAGGPPSSTARRGGLLAESWALAWHRVLAAGWYLRHAATGDHPPHTDPDHAVIIRRQLTVAVDLFSG